jgi:hypothetical protein
MLRRRLGLAIPAIALLSIALGAVGTEAARAGFEPPARLWRDYVAMSVGNGEKRTPFSRARNITFSLSDRSGDEVAPGRWIGWEAGCNSAGGRVRVGPHRFFVGLISTTAVGCPPRENREDFWLYKFFESNPHWRLSKGYLILRSGTKVIRLAPDAARRASPRQLSGRGAAG